MPKNANAPDSNRGVNLTHLHSRRHAVHFQTTAPPKFRRAIAAVCPQQFAPKHFEQLRQLDRRLDRLAIEIEAGYTPQCMPAYWHVWRSYQRRLGDILRHPRHPFLRHEYARSVAFDALRRLYWEAAIREVAS